jgi:hypothetical protein
MGGELLVWIYAFEKNIAENYLGAFVITMILGAIMHYRGVRTTYAKYHITRVNKLISLGVPGFDLIQGIVVTIAYFISQKI